MPVLNRLMKRSYMKFHTGTLERNAGHTFNYRSLGLRFKSTSTSEDEISHFQELAPSWWDTNGSQRILHLMNNARMDFIQDTLKNNVKINNPDVYVPGFNYRDFLPQYVSLNVHKELDSEIYERLLEQKRSVLDIGCGGGILSEALARLPFVEHVTGIDLTPECINVAREHAMRDPMLAEKVVYEYKSLEETQGTYDIVTCFEMLEHVDVPAEILRHAWQRLKPNGILFLSTINRDFISWFTTIFMGEYMLKIVPQGTHHLSKYIKSTEIKEWFEKNEPSSHEVLKLKGTMYLPLKGWVEHECSDIGNFFMAIQKTSL